MNNTEHLNFKDYQRMETLVNEGLRIAMNRVMADESLNIILSYLGQILQADRVYIFEKNKKGNDDNTYEWVREGVTAEIQNLQDLPAEVCAKWYQDFTEGKITAIRDLEEIEETDPLQYENLKAQNISSIITVPLYDHGIPIGFYGVDNPPVQMMEYTANLLQMMGHFVLAFLHLRNLQRKLHHLSYYDDLTMVGNRRLFADVMEQLMEEEVVGFAYCDVTGLKRVNDEQGHLAGDKLLQDAVRALRSVFSEDELFRLGGDEFVAVDKVSDETTFNKKVELLRRESLQQQVNLAIGHAWQYQPKTQLDALLSKAEQDMYNDKAEYYKRTGISRRR